MSILTEAKPPARKPLIITLYGPPGAGKTTTALAITQGLKPFLIRTVGEGLPRDVPAEQMPVELGETSTPDMLWDQLQALANDDHPHRAVIIDTVGGLETMFVQALLDKEPGRNMNQVAGGYGAGRNVVAADHMRVRKIAERIRERGIYVIFLAHSDIARIEPPDSDAYTSYQLRLHVKSQSPYVDAVDLVGFVKQATVLRGEEGAKKAISSGERVLVAQMTPSATTKNRLGITEDIDIVQGVNPLAEYMRRPRRAAAKVEDQEVPQEGEEKS